MERVKIKTYAKLNLTLELFGVENGYHQLDSLVASIDICDTLVLSKRKDNLVGVTMHGLGSESIPPEQNNAVKAGEAFIKAFQTTGADVTVYKDIPIGAGLGGSSADIAGVLLGMAKLYNIPQAQIEALAETLGSDVKYMLKGGFMRMQGRGEKLTPTKIDDTLHFLLLCPRSPVSTKECFSYYDTLPKTLEWRESATENCITALTRNDKNEGGRYLTNELYPSACALNSEVEKAYNDLKSFSPLGVGMSGAGSCVFALFETRELCEWAKSRYKGNCRAYTVKTVTPEKKRKSIFRNPFVLTDGE